jgi:thiol-disulfide isomerase/thioredoxin
MRTLPAAALFLLACAGARPLASPSPLVGQPFEVSASDLFGREARIEADQGRVVVVDFFATWCEPCRAQLPRLAGLSRALGARGLSVYAVSFDESRAALEGFIDGPASGIPLLWDRGGERLAPVLSISRLPTTFVVDRHGVIRSVHVGYDGPAGDRLEVEVRALLEERVNRAAAR